MTNWWEADATVDELAAPPPMAKPPAGGAPAPAAPAGGPEWWKADPTPQELTQGSGRRPRPIGDSLDRAASTMQATVAGLAPDQAGQIKLFAQRMNIPENRFGVVDGEIVYADENGDLQRAVPSYTGGGLKELLPRASARFGAAAGEAFPQLVGGASGFAGSVVGPVTGILASGAGAAAADIGRQFIANRLIGDEGRGIDPLNAAGHAAMSAGGQAIGTGANWLFSRNRLGVGAGDRIAAMDAPTRQRIADLEAEANRRGIDLSAGQATGMRSLLVQERRLGRYDETADTMANFARNQREVQVPRAIRNEIDTISTARGEPAVNRFRESAESIIDAKRAEQAKAADALYTEAFQANQSVASPAIDRLLETPAGKEALKRAVVKMQNQMSLVGRPDPELTEAMREAAELGKMDYVKGGVASGLKLRTLDYVKRALGDMEQGAIATSNRDDARIFGELRRGLTKELDRLDETAKAGPNSFKPEGGAYARARREYGTGADALETLTEGGIGFLRDMDGPARQNIVTRVFSGENLPKEEIGRMRQQFLLAGKIDDWNAGLASYLADKLRAATVEGVQGASMGNVPGKFRRMVWGDEGQREVIKAAMGDPTKIAGFEKFMEVLEAASRSLPEGSPTVTDLGAGGEAVGRGLRFVGKALSPGTYVNLPADLVEGLNQLRLPGARERLAKAVLAGDYAKELSNLRMLPATGEKALAVAGQILAQSGLTAAGGRALFGPGDFDPPAVAGGATR